MIRFFTHVLHRHHAIVAIVPPSHHCPSSPLVAMTSANPIIEPYWAAFITHFSKFQLHTLLTFVIHEVAYFLTYLYFHLLDKVPSLRSYKIQPDKSNTPPLIRNCFLKVMRNHLLIVLPIIFVTHPVFDLMGTTHSVESLPDFGTIALHIVFFVLVEDLVFYIGHRLLHLPYLYKNIHSVHHEHAAPFGLAAEYAHPIEVIFLGTATIAGPMIIGPHLFTLYLYLTLRAIQTVECHSGYDFPWSLNRWFPLYGGADFHDHHHRIHSGNYSSMFTWVDALMGTDSSYQIWKRKQRARQSVKAH